MNRYALVVGIDRYPFLEDAEGRAKHLKTPASDAEAIAQLLEADRNFRVRRLPCSEIDDKLQVDPDKPLEADELLDEITKLFLPKEDRDTALLFFAGHGLPKPLGNLKQILLATSDANPRRKKWHGVLLRDLRDIVEQSPVKEQIIWLDSCHSGELLEFKNSDLLGQVPGRKRFLIAASHSSEVAYERLDGKHGVLSGALIEGLNPNRMLQNQWINDRKLADFVEEELKAYYDESKIPQEPQIRRPDGEIKLVLGKSSANAAESTQPKTSIVRKIPFVLPQLDVSTFTGREEELQQLEELLLNRQGTKICSIASLAGVGGIGKSALACHFATIHKDDFPDGVIGLRVDGKEIDAIAREFARYGEEIDSEDERDASTIMQEVFAYRRMLLIFDNAEESSIRALRPGGDRCAVIVTTRDHGLPISLDIPDEGRINLPPLPDPESLRLLETLIGKERVAIEPEAARNLIQLTGKLPLALQIIGAGLKLNEGRKLTDYVASLRDERKRLERMEVEGDEHLDLRACFSLSLNQLQPEKINFFACLSLCASDGFSRRTATATSGFNDEYDAQKYLDYLCRISLLNYAEVGENRFVFHSLIRLFARELLVDRGLEEEATARHAEFCINLVKSFNPNNSDIGVSIIGEEIDDIILAAEWLQKNGVADYNLAESLNDFFEDYGYWSKATHLMRGFQALAESREDWEAVVTFRTRQAKYFAKQNELPNAEAVLAPLPDIISRIENPNNRQRSEIKWLIRLGRIRQQQQLFDAAVNALQRGVTIAEELGEQDSLRKVLDSLANIFKQQRKWNEAVDAFQRVVEISEALNDRRQIAIGLNGLAGVFQQQGNLKEAAATFQQVVEINEALNDRRQIAIGLNGLAAVLQQQGKLDEAAATFQRRVEISEAFNDQRSVAIGLNGLAGVFQQQGKLDQAAATFQRVVEINQAFNDQRSVAIGLNGLGGVFQQQGKLDEAMKIFRRSVAIEEQFGNQRGLTMTLTSLSRVLRKLGRFEETIETLERIAVVEKELGNQRGEAITLTYLSGVLREQGRHEEAIQTLDRILAIEKQLDNQQQQVMTLIRLGAVSQQQGNLNDAIDNFERSLELSKEIGDQQLQMLAMSDLGGILHHQGRLLLTQKESWNEAEEVLHRSQDIFEELDDFRNLAMVLNSLGGLLRKQRKWEAAEATLRYCYNLSEKLKDQRGQAIIFNSLGQVLSQQQDAEKFKLALMYFRASIKLGQELDDQPHLAKVYTAMGQALLSNRETEQAIIQLIQGFEIDEKSRNSFGLALVTPHLTSALGKLGRQNEALAYCQRALAIAPKNRKLQELCDRLSSPNSIKKGTVKHIRYNTEQRCYWGHITPNDRTADIYFRERFIDSDCIAQLKPGAIVEVEVEQTAKGPCANNIRAC